MPFAVPGSEERADRPLESRLKWLMFGRLFLAVACIGGVLLSEPEGLGYPPYYVLVAACLLNLIYLIVARLRVGLRLLAVGQLVLDVCLVGLLVYLSGIYWFFAFLYLPIVIASAMIVGPRMAVAMASTGTVVLAAVSTAYFLSNQPNFAFTLPFVDEKLIVEHVIRLNFLLPFLFFFALSLHVAAFMAGRQTAEMRRVRILNDEILQNMTGGVLAADALGELQFVNGQAAVLLGLRDPYAARGRPVEEVVPPALAELLRKAVEGQDRVEDEIRINGVLVGVGVSRLVEGATGPLRGVVAILNDLSLRTHMEEMARRADRFKALLEMSAGMAHEIRNPLASIRGAAQELNMTGVATEEDRQLLEVVVRESDRLNQIISEFLDYASDRPPETVLFDVAALLRETAVLLEARGDRSVEIVQEIPDSVVCRGEPDRLKQVFLNLGINALDACAGNGKGGRVVIQCVPARAGADELCRGARVQFSDNGRGVPADETARVFDPFFTTKPEGTGMGLAVARKIVLSHGGEIHLESREGKGAEVSVWLPS